MNRNRKRPGIVLVSAGIPLLALTLCPPVFPGITASLPPAGARSRALAFSSFTALSRPSDFLHNPGARGNAEPWLLEAGCFSPFGMTELTQSLVAAVMNRKPWRAGTALAGFGSDAYNELTLKAAAGYTAGPRISAGAGLEWTRIHIRDHSEETRWGGSLGAVLAWCSWLHAGFLLCVPAADIKSSRFCSGLEFRPHTDVHLYIRFTRSSRTRSCWSAGLEHVLPRFRMTIRTGYDQETGQWCSGAGFTLGFAFLDYAVQFHPDLGSSHMVSLSVMP